MPDRPAPAIGSRRVQGVLDELWRTAPADQPVLVRDARWLFALAQSPTTDELWPISKSRNESQRPFRQRTESKSIKPAFGWLAGTYVKLRHHSTQKGVPIDEHSLVLSTRNSNALDLALLTQGLVPLLEAYERAWQRGDSQKRLELAAAICQGVSPDPELFVNRLDLLGPYSMVEYLFTTTDRDGHAIYTPVGRRHVQLLQGYEA